MTQPNTADLGELVARIQKRVDEIEAHTAKYPSWVGGTTWQHAQDLKALLEDKARLEGERDVIMKTRDSLFERQEDLHRRAQKAEAERDALKARVAEVLEPLALAASTAGARFVPGTEYLRRAAELHATLGDRT